MRAEGTPPAPNPVPRAPRPGPAIPCGGRFRFVITEEVGEGHGGPQVSERFGGRGLQDVAAGALHRAPCVAIQDRADVVAAPAETGVASGRVEREECGGSLAGCGKRASTFRPRKIDSRRIKSTQEAVPTTRPPIPFRLSLHKRQTFSAAC